MPSIAVNSAAPAVSARRSFRRILALALLAATLLTTVTSCSRHSAFLERSVMVGGVQYRYRVWLPAHYTKLHRWPVVLFLHGSAERGDDNTRQLDTALPAALEKYGDRYRCIVVIPQCRPGQEWYGDMETQALAALDASVREFRGDPRRIALTGVSMGGSGAWYMARHRHHFAAVVPVCGEVSRRADDPFPIDPPPDVARIVGSRDPFSTLAAAIGNMPVWAFHGADDSVVPVTQSRLMIAALHGQGNAAHYTEYVGVGHECWDIVYADEALVRWLLRQRT